MVALLEDCLDDDTISAFCILARHSAELHEPGSSISSFLSPLAATSFSMDPTNPFLSPLKEHVTRYAWGTFSKTIFPVCWVQESHWVLVVIDWDAHKWDTYNSYPQIRRSMVAVGSQNLALKARTYANRHAPRLQPLRKVVAWLLDAYNQPDTSLTFTESMIIETAGPDGPIKLCDQGDNETDCGVYVCWWAYRLILNKPLTPLQNMRDVREWMIGVFMLYLQKHPASDMDLGWDNVSLQSLT